MSSASRKKKNQYYCKGVKNTQAFYSNIQEKIHLFLHILEGSQKRKNAALNIGDGFHRSNNNKKSSLTGEG